MSQSEGNTLPRSRRWCFTYHNYQKSDCHRITETFNAKKWSYLFSEELGENKETPHLQGYIEHTNAIRGETIKEAIDKTVHIEVAKGKLIDQFKYIKKEGGVIYTNITEPYTEKPKNIIEELLPWQQKYADLINTEPEPRKIYWIYDPDGNKGKSEFCRYMMRNKKAMWIRTAKANDIKMLLLEHKNCRDLIFDLPRDDCTISYALLEELKDGLIFSGKYEGGIKEISIPHIIIMSNNQPMYTRLSEDRLVVEEI